MTAFITALFDTGTLLPAGADGLYGRSALHEKLVAALTRLILTLGAPDHAESLRFPPILARADFERAGYFRHFGPLTGAVSCFCGDEEDHREAARKHDSGEDWTSALSAADLVLTPAACYPVYPVIAARRDLPQNTIIDAASWCFRREPSSDPARQQMFRMHERVFIGDSEHAATFIAAWLARVRILAETLNLPHEIAPASDPFFGATGRLLARRQLESAYKHELLIPLTNPEAPTACASVNDHLTKMSSAWNIRLANGDLAVTACAGFGLDRLALAILRHHGFDPAGWPAALHEPAA